MVGVDEHVSFKRNILCSFKYTCEGLSKANDLETPAITNGNVGGRPSLQLKHEMLTQERGANDWLIDTRVCSAWGF